MAEIGSERERDQRQAGLCAECQHAKRITSDRGSVFWFCELSKVDARFVKYPRIPVRECAGYRRKDLSEERRDER